MEILQMDQLGELEPCGGRGSNKVIAMCHVNK